ncbi:MAG: O-antigen ligase family protein [Gallionella sp.]|nr:O-antigen ligase family protein [Gallionella sp.]
MLPRSSWFWASTALIGLAVPISTAISNVCLAAVLLGGLFYGRAIWQMVKSQPVAQAAWLLFGALWLGTLYGATPWREAMGLLGKYIDLAFIPLFMLMLSGEVARRWAQRAFFAASGLILFLSYLVGLKLLSVQHWMTTFSAVDNPVIFHSHITQNNMMAMAIFLALLNAREAVSNKLRWVWAGFASLALFNVLFMVIGRTGYLILFTLLGWLAWATLARYAQRHGKTWGIRQAMLIVIGMMAVIVLALQLSPRLHERVSAVVSEYQAWQPNHGEGTSTGERLDFYYNTLQIIQQHPLVGVGTGGFAAAFAQQTAGTAAKKTPNPHNEYLMMTAQIGLAGGLLLLFLFYTQWRCAPRLATPYAQDAARGLVLAYMVNCSFNSALLDHADGLFFAWLTALLFADTRHD